MFTEIMRYILDLADRNAANRHHHLLNYWG
jgi:hypothetical protein